jgi:hypothetical protein
MKIFLKASYFSILFIVITTAGCKKILDINRSPNVPGVEQANAKLVFPSAVMATAAQVGGEYAILGSIWGQYATQSAFANQYRTWEQYNLNGLDFEDSYEGLFVRALPNFQLIINQAREQKNWNFFLMATVMKAYTTQVLVDLYGDIPFTEALQGSANLNPKFDDGYSIYKSLIDSLDAALAKDFTASTNIPGGSADIVFPGAGTGLAADADWIASNNINKWIQFANTLELKMFLRMVNKKPTEAQAGIQKLYNSGAQFLTVDAGVGGFIAEPGQDNPMYEQNIQGQNTSTNLRATYTLASFLKVKADPRISYFYGSTTPTAMHQGDYLNIDPAYGTVPTLAERATDPVIFISAAESYFMQAEARLRYFSGTGAKALYDQGVLAAFASMGQNGASFIAPGGVYEYPSGGTFEQQLEAIIVQKWISFGYGVHYLEGYFERNRTGYPKTSPVYSTDPSYVPGQFVVSKNSVLGAGLFAKRLPYPNEERTGNPNTPASVPLSTPVWWSL